MLESKSSRSGLISKDNEEISIRTSGEIVAETVVPAEAAVSQEQQGNEKEDEVTQDYVSGYKLLFAMAAMNLSAILINLDSSILSTATPTITNEFHSVKDIGWYISSYQLAVSALQPLTGKFFTYFQNKWTYIIFLGLFEIGSLVCGLATTSKMFIGGRAIAGLGASGLFNGSLTIVYGMVPAQKRPAMTGLLMGIAQTGVIAGPLIGGSLTQYTTWRWCFYINLPIGGLACILLALVHIPEQIPKPKFRTVITDPNILQKFDILGSLILVPAVIQLLLALHYGGSEYAWNSPTVIGLFCGFVGTTTLFLWWEYRAGENALMPLGVLRQKVLVFGSLWNLSMAGVSYIASYFIPIYFQSILGDSPFESGVHMLPSIISQSLTAVLSGFMISKLGYYLPWAVFSGILITVSTVLISAWSPTTSTGEWIGYQILYGTGRGIGMQIALIAVQAVLPQSQIAIAITILVFGQGLGSAILISIANTIFDTSIDSQIRIQAPNVDPEAVIAAGATAFRDIVTPEDLASVLKAWANSFDHTIYLAIGLSAVMFLSAWGLGWNDLRKKKEPVSAQVEKGEKGEDNV